MWRKPWFLSQGPVLGAPCRRVTLATDASLTGMSGHPARGLWSGCHLTWHINWLEMLAAFLSTQTLSSGPKKSPCVSMQPTIQWWLFISTTREVCVRAPLTSWRTRILGWSQDKFLSLRAVYVLGHLKVRADILLRQGPRARGMEA